MSSLFFPLVLVWVALVGTVPRTRPCHSTSSTGNCTRRRRDQHFPQRLCALLLDSCALYNLRGIGPSSNWTLTWSHDSGDGLHGCDDDHSFDGVGDGVENLGTLQTWMSCTMLNCRSYCFLRCHSRHSQSDSCYACFSSPSFAFPSFSS